MDRAREILGVKQDWLGFVDSGWPEGDPKPPLPEGCFALVPIEEAAEPLVRLIRSFKPHVLTTYDENGGYPHPDHIKCHEISVYAYEAAADPERYPDAGEAVAGVQALLPPSWSYARMEAIDDEMKKHGLENPFAERLEAWERKPEDEARLTTRVECADYFGVRDAGPAGARDADRPQRLLVRDPAPGAGRGVADRGLPARGLQGRDQPPRGRPLRGSAPASQRQRELVAALGRRTGHRHVGRPGQVSEAVCAEPRQDLDVAADGAVLVRPGVPEHARALAAADRAGEPFVAEDVGVPGLAVAVGEQVRRRAGALDVAGVLEGDLRGRDAAAGVVGAVLGLALAVDVLDDRLVPAGRLNRPVVSLLMCSLSSRCRPAARSEVVA